MTTYKIKPGAAIMAVRQDGTQEEKVATKLKIYHEADDLVTHLSFRVKPGSLWREFILEKDQVEILPAIVVEDGEFNFEQDGYVFSFRLHHDCDGFFAGKQVVSIWSNELDAWFDVAHLDENGGMHVWKAYRDFDFDALERELIRMSEEKGNA